MHDEITHMRIVHRLLRPRLPGRESRGIVWEYADDFDLIEILERHMLEVGQFTTDDKIKKLTVRHRHLS